VGFPRHVPLVLALTTQNWGIVVDPTHSVLLQSHLVMEFGVLPSGMHGSDDTRERHTSTIRRLVVRKVVCIIFFFLYFVFVFFYFFTSKVKVIACCRVFETYNGTIPLFNVRLVGYNFEL